MAATLSRWLRYHATCGGEHAHDASAIAVEGMTAGYPGPVSPVLENISFTLECGQCVALVGDNGAGKSTLLKALAGLLPITSGQVHVLGHGVGKCHHQVAYLPQHRDIDWGFPINVRGFVATGLYIHLGWFRRPGKNDLARAERVLEQSGLAALASRRLNELSGGQQQRILLARTLLHNADLLLLDEPLNAVDADNRARLVETFRDLKAAGKTLVIATHEWGAGADLFDRVYRVADRRLTEEAP